MLRSSLSIAVYATLFSVITKMVIFSVDTEDYQYIRYSTFAYLLLILLSSFGGIWLFRSKAEGVTTFIQDMKAGVRVTSLYAVLVSFFTFIYYKLIDPGFFQFKIEQAVVIASENENADLDQARETAEFVFNAFTHSTFTLFAFVFLGALYSVILTWLVRKMPK